MNDLVNLNVNSYRIRLECKPWYDFQPIIEGLNTWNIEGISAGARE